MMNFAAAFDRVPKFVLFGAAGLIQIGLIGLMVTDRAEILRAGRDVTLLTRPLDPRDFLRGDYVVLGYDISSVPAGIASSVVSTMEAMCSSCRFTSWWWW